MLSSPLTTRHAAHLLLLAAMRAGTFNPEQARDEAGKWTGGGGGGVGTDVALEKLNALPTHPEDSALKVSPFKLSDKDYDVIDYLADGDFKFEQFKPTIDLLSVQTDISPDKVSGLIRDFDKWSQSASQTQMDAYLDEPGVDGTPVVVFKGGKQIIFDGNNRFAAAFLLGRSVKAAVVRLDKLRGAIFNQDQARDEHGRWIDQGGFLSSPSDAVHELANGDIATVSKADVRAVVEKAAHAAGPIDITNLSIEGSPLFVGGLNRDRSTMPQIPKEHQERFLNTLRDKGISVTEEHVSPVDLLPTQNEIDAVRIGQKLREYDKGEKTMRSIMVSEDDYVLDGHHRWAVQVVVAMDSPREKIQVPIIRLGAAHGKALDLMLDYTRKNKISNRALARHSETALHRAADKHVARLAVAVRYAFAHGRMVINKDLLRKAIDAREQLGPLVMPAANAVATALTDVMPATLREVLKTGGDVGVQLLKDKIKSIKVVPRAAELRTAKGPADKPAINFTFNATDQRAIDWADRHAAELVTRVSETTRQDINNAIADLLETGDWETAYDDLLAAVGDEGRATLIARNETMTAVSEGQRQAWDQAVDGGLLTGDEKRTWIVTPDEKLCPICDGLDGKVATLNGSYISDDGDEYDGPPAHVSCVIGSTVVEGNVVAATRMLYAGQVREVVTAQGRRLTVTPNHPIASLRGFLPAHQLKEGDYLLAYDERLECCHPAPEALPPARSVSFSPHEEQNGPTAIEQVFSSLQLSGKFIRAKRLGTEFHGDAMSGDGDIDIVYVDRELGYGIEASLSDQRQSLRLESSYRFAHALGDQQVMGPGVALSEPTVAAVSERIGISEHCKARRFGLTSNLDTAIGEMVTEFAARDASFFGEVEERFTGCIASDYPVEVLNGSGVNDSCQSFDFTHFPENNAAPSELISEAPQRDASFVRELRKRLSSQVALDEVVEIRDRDDFRGHVYNLQTVSGIIIAHGLAISNCRCTEGIA